MTKALTVLIVDDNRTNLSLMGMLVRKIPGCETVIFSDPKDVLEQLDTVSFDIGLIDYQMPGQNGVELIKKIIVHPLHCDKPMVIITADKDSTIKMEALEAGAVEFMTKPIEPIEFTARLRNLIKLSEVQHRLKDHASLLKSEVDKATKELRDREEEIIVRLSRAAGYKDAATVQHTTRVGQYSRILAIWMGLNEEQCRNIQLASLMHDIGKAGIRDDVLLKNEALSRAEREHMNTHTSIGASILADSSCELLRLAAEIAVSHHEFWDGTGYPKGIKGEAIPLSGRIVAVADVFDALTTARPYKAAWDVEEAFQYLQSQSGRQFDPKCVEAFMSGYADIKMILNWNAGRALTAA